MEPNFWLSRWDEGKIGFHADQVHADLLTYGERWLSPAPGDAQKRILVPLCGKTRDLAHLAKLGHSVVGVELSERAAQAAFDEAGLVFQRSEQGPFQVFRASTLDLEIRVGDVFALPAEPSFDAVWDRAAMVALDPERRARYAARLCQVLRPGGTLLVNTMDYPQEQMPGPPHAVSFADLEGYYAEHFTLELLRKTEEIERSPKFKERGLSSFVVQTSLLTRR